MAVRSPHPLFTIGYEQAKPAAVLDELARAKIDTLVDVRAVAASRRPGFSKRQLAAAVDEAGIAYIHLQKLGTPAEGRQAARAGDRITLERVFEMHIKKLEPQAALEELAGSSNPAGGSSCSATAAIPRPATAAGSLPT